MGLFQAVIGASEGVVQIRECKSARQGKRLAGLHSIRVISQWRLVFRWDGSRGEAEGVYLDDHSYR